MTEINKAEKDLNLKFSEEYKSYLLNYGFATYEGHELTGICKAKRLNVVEVTKAERNNNPNVPNDCYVIETANIDGIVIWQNEDGLIFQSSPNTNSVELYNSLCEYILSCSN